ncbi:MAG: alanine racemase [Oscillospiraceae bacterium]|nr:alanine racemase [Oscillospiraceae bacterium]
MKAGRLKQLAEKYGTPLYVFDKGELLRRFAGIRKAAGDEVGLCFAVKANPFLIEALCDTADSFEVCSPGELELCAAAGISGSKIVFSGVNKTELSVARAFDLEVSLFTAESKRQLDIISEEARKRQKTARVILRLSSGAQFGMDKETLFGLLRIREDRAFTDIEGIHYFTGTMKRSAEKTAQEAEYLSSVIDEAEKTLGFKTRLVEYGPGFGVPYFDSEPDEGLSLLESAVQRLGALKKGRKLVLEMGRYFSASCGVYLTAVNDIKTSDGANYCIVDGGINHISYYGAMMGMKRPLIEHIPRFGADGPDEKWCVCGSLCTFSDILVRDAQLRGLSPGDILAFKNAGAYCMTEGLSLFLSRALPAVVLVDTDGGDALLRQAVETYPLNK